MPDTDIRTKPINELLELDILTLASLCNVAHATTLNYFATWLGMHEVKLL